VIPAPWKEDANDQTPPEVCFCYFVCITVTNNGEWHFLTMAIVGEQHFLMIAIIGERHFPMIAIVGQ
jgi:hypothetical protein